MPDRSQFEGCEVVSWPIENVKPYAGNPRIHRSRGIKALAESIKRYGFRQPLVVDKAGELVIGHGRLQAAKLLKRDQVPVVVAGDLTEGECRELRLADNKIGELSDWNVGALDEELQALTAAGSVMSEVGFYRLELSDLDSLAPPASKKAPAETDIQPGDVLVFGGRHRLIVGDCRDPEVRGELFENHGTPRVAVTDPPYGVHLDVSWRVGTLQKNTKPSARQDVGGYGDVGAESIPAFVAAIAESGVDVAWAWLPSSGPCIAWLNAFAEARMVMQHALVWIKPSPVASRGHIAYQHEMLYLFVRRGKPRKWRGGLSQRSVFAQRGRDWWPEQRLPDDVIFAALEGGGYTSHPSEKPIECMARPIRWTVAPDEGVYEPFLGSGSTLMAAEREGRVCFACEVQPVFAEMVRRRWVEEVGPTVDLVKA